MALEKDYEIICRLGEGSFGKVYKARHRVSDDIVAVKQIKVGAKSWDEACRSTELQALRKLRHAFVVRLRELMRSPSDGSLYYIFEFVGSDLAGLIDRNKNGLAEEFASRLMRQLLLGLNYIHQSNFFHRDIKPENVLYDAPSETLRIADFGEARSLRARPPFTDYIGTRWYRAPECLLRDRAYSSPVDVWAAGLVFAELVRGAPVFRGKTSIDQLYQILQVCGQPSSGEWPEYKKMADAIRFRAPEKGCGLERVLPKASGLFKKMISFILVLNPRRRPPARRCLEHELMAQLPPMPAEQLERRPSNDSSVLQDADTTLPADDVVTAADDDIPVANAGLDAGEDAAKPSGPVGKVSAESDLGLDVDLDAELDAILGDDDIVTEKPAGSACTPATAQSSRCETPSTRLTSASSHPHGSDHLPGSDGNPQQRSAVQREREFDDLADVDDLLDGLCADFDAADVASELAPPVAETHTGASNAHSNQGYQSAADRAPSPAPTSPSAHSNTWDDAADDLPIFGAPRVGDVGRSETGRDLNAALDKTPSKHENNGYSSIQETPTAWEGSISADDDGELPPAASPDSNQAHACKPAPADQSEPSFEEADSEAEFVGGTRDAKADTVMQARSLKEEDVRPSIDTLERSSAWAGKDELHVALEEVSTKCEAAAVPSGDLAQDSASRGDCLRTVPTLEENPVALPRSRSRDGDQNRAPNRIPASWPTEELHRLRRVVKRLANEGHRGDELWPVVSSQIGNGRSAKDCKRQYRDAYHAHKSASAAAKGA